MAIWFVVSILVVILVLMSFVSGNTEKTGEVISLLSFRKGHTQVTCLRVTLAL